MLLYRKEDTWDTDKNGQCSQSLRRTTVQEEPCSADNESVFTCSRFSVAQMPEHMTMSLIGAIIFSLQSRACACCGNERGRYCDHSGGCRCAPGISRLPGFLPDTAATARSHERKPVPYLVQRHVWRIDRKGDGNSVCST